MQAGSGCIVACEKDAESRFISFLDPGLTQSCYVVYEIAGAPLTTGNLGARVLQPTARSKARMKRGGDEACAMFSSVQMASVQACAMFSSAPMAPVYACAVFLSVKVTPEHTCPVF